MVAAPEWKGGRPGEPIFTGSGSLKNSLSLPDIAQVDRRNQAYKTGWIAQVTRVEELETAMRNVAERRKQDLDVSLARQGRSLPRVRSAKKLLATPLPANITPLEFESKTTGLREAQAEMHQDCLRREEAARREQIARREATWAADRAEALKFLREEASFRVQSNWVQQAEGIRHRRVLQAQRSAAAGGDRAEKLKEGNAEKAVLEEARQQHAQQVAQAQNKNRSHKTALQAKKENEAREKAKEREEAAKHKQQANAARRELIAQQQAADKAKRLEKTWKYADAQLARAEEEFRMHVQRFGLEKQAASADAAASGASGYGVEEFGMDLSEAAATGEEADDEGKLGDGSTRSLMGSLTGSTSVFYDDFAQAELTRLRARVALAKRRAKAARDSYEVERVKGLTPEEKMMEDWLKSQQ